MVQIFGWENCGEGKFWWSWIDDWKDRGLLNHLVWDRNIHYDQSNLLDFTNQSNIDKHFSMVNLKIALIS